MHETNIKYICFKYCPYMLGVGGNSLERWSEIRIVNYGKWISSQMNSGYGTDSFYVHLVMTKCVTLNEQVVYSQRKLWHSYTDLDNV